MTFRAFVSVDLPIPVIIPTDYVPDRALRLQLYRRLAELGTEQAIADMSAELNDRFGPLPEPVENLLFQLQIKILAARAGVEAVAGEDGQIVLKASRWESDADRSQVAVLLGAGVRVSKRQVRLPRASQPHLWRERLVEILEKLASSFVPAPTALS